MNPLDQYSMAAAQRDKVNAHVFQHSQVCIDGESAVKDKFTGKGARSGFPIPYKVQNSILLGFFSKGGIRITKDMGLNITGQHREDPKLAPTSFGDKMFLE